MNNIFDSHSHYTESAFDCDREELLNNLPFKGVEKNSYRFSLYGGLSENT